MDKIVVDSSVVIKWFVAEPHSAESRRVLDRYQSGSTALLAPDLLIAELGNIVWKKHTKQDMAASDAQLIIQTFRTLPIAFTSAIVLLDSAYQLAVTHKRSIYDMLYMALSLREQCVFVTADERLVNAMSGTYTNAIWIGKWV